MILCQDCKHWEQSAASHKGIKRGFCQVIFCDDYDIKATLTDPASLLTYGDFGCVLGETK